MPYVIAMPATVSSLVTSCTITFFPTRSFCRIHCISSIVQLHPSDDSVPLAAPELLNSCIRVRRANSDKSSFLCRCDEIDAELEFGTAELPARLSIDPDRIFVRPCIQKAVIRCACALVFLCLQFIDARGPFEIPSLSCYVDEVAIFIETGRGVRSVWDAVLKVSAKKKLGKKATPAGSRNVKLS